MISAGEMARYMVAGKEQKYQGEVWIILENAGLKMADGRVWYTAVRKGELFPAPVHVIPGPEDLHLQPRKEK